MIFKKLLVLVISVLINYSVHVAQTTDRLKIGDNAPPILLSKWIRGDSVTSFKMGRIYVIEFERVGCAPCRAAIPHLTKLARKYSSKVTIISIFTDGHLPKIERFVRNVGTEIGYSVAADSPSKTMANTWMKPAGQNGIPVSFVIGEDGTILWIGNPIDLAGVVDEVVKKTFDPSLAAIKQQERAAYYATIVTDKKNSNFESALSKINVLIANNPDNPNLPIEKFDILLSSNEDEAYKYGWELLRGPFKDIEPSLFYLARCLMERKSDLRNPDWNLVIELTKRAAFLCKAVETTAIILDTQSKAFHNMGDNRTAIEVQERAIKMLNVYPFHEIEIIHRYLSQTLEVYKNKINQD